MKKAIIICVVATALLASCNSGSVMQKEIVVDGKTVTKDLCVKNIILYNSDGHTIRFKDKNGRDEKYSGKDSKKTKPKKSAKGVIREYDANGKEIYYPSPGAMKNGLYTMPTETKPTQRIQTAARIGLNITATEK